MQKRYDEIVALMDDFCRELLNPEYAVLAQRMAAALCRKRPSPLAAGQPRTWACGILHALGRINFLSDRSTEPYLTMAEMCAAFGVGCKAQQTQRPPSLNAPSTSTNLIRTGRFALSSTRTLLSGCSRSEA